MTEQNKSMSDLESDIAKSRERLAATIDELAFRAQPKNIVAEQKRNLRNAVMDKYHSLMGTSSSRTVVAPASSSSYDSRYDSNASKTDQAKAKAEDLKATALAKVDELKAQATAKGDELKAQATAKVDDLKSRNESHGQHAAANDGQSGLADLKTRAQVKADQARLKMEEATHDEDGELRADRIATGLAILGATLISMGVAKRNMR